MEQTQVKSFAQGARMFFGLKEGESLQEFLGEIKALSPEDKTEIADGLAKNGIVIL